MRKLTLPLFFCFLCVSTLAQDTDAEGCKDSKLFNRMPNTIISECSNDYNEMEVKTGKDKVETKEGTKTSISYNYQNEEATAPSFFQIVKNFENAITKTGGKRMYYSADEGVATLFGKSDGKDIWVILNDLGGIKKGCFQLHILEMEAMKQEITASEMLEAINKSGSISLQINFETGKSAIKPDSEVIVNQIAEMLKADPSLKVSIEGHTDNVGSPGSNKVLSEARAKSVVAALSAKGIDKTRLSAKGWGQEKPVADNGTDEGKAKNRRVDVVKI